MEKPGKRYLTPEKIEGEIAQIAFLEVQQSVGLAGVTDEVLFAAKNKAAHMVEEYVGHSVKNTYAAPGDYKAYLRMEMRTFPGECLKEALKGTKLARQLWDELQAFRKNKLKEPEYKEAQARRAFHVAQWRFCLYFHRDPAVPWSLEQLETMCETKEFIENAPAKALKKTKKGHACAAVSMYSETKRGATK